ncbi:hypothetical protein MYSE111917_27435 [Mycobacterium senriense]
MNIRRPGAQAATNSPGQASPTVISRSSASRRARSSDDNTVGVKTAALTRWPCINPVSASPAYASGGATTNVAADATTNNHSKSDASKVGAATAKTRASGPNPNASRCAAATPSRPAWLTATPLGTPVDPDVKIT